MSVKAGKEIIAALNEVLEGELAAINQYFLHAKMLQNWGYERLYKKVYHESIDEMKHADVLVERILYLDGIPNVQKIGRVRIGETVEEMFACDVALEEQAIPRLQRFVKLCRDHYDYGSRALLYEILRCDEEHLDWLETQQTLIQQVGLQAYLAEQIKE